MRVFNALRIQLPKGIEVLRRRFGVPATIFFPMKFNNKEHGYFDEDITYDEGRQARVLIPALFRMQNRSLGVLDPYFNPDDIVMFEPNPEVVYPRFTKIECQYQGLYKNFIINDIQEIKDDEAFDDSRVIFRKYILVPSVSIDVETNRDALIDALNREEDIEPGEYGHKPDVSVAESLKPNEKGFFDIDRIS